MSAHDDELDPEILDALALSLPSARPPDPSLRNTLFERIGGRDRFLPFVDRVASLFDLPDDEAEEHLHSIDRDDDWEDLVPGVRFRDFEGGPGLGEAHAGLIRVAPGEAFPHHSHVGEERLLVLQGRVQDDAGTTYRAGDVIVSADGTAHELKVVGDQEVIYAAVVIALQFTGDDDDDDDD